MGMCRFLPSRRNEHQNIMMKYDRSCIRVRCYGFDVLIITVRITPLARWFSFWVLLSCVLQFLLVFEYTYGIVGKQMCAVNCHLERLTFVRVCSVAGCIWALSAVQYDLENDRWVIPSEIQILLIFCENALLLRQLFSVFPQNCWTSSIFKTHFIGIM